MRSLPLLMIPLLAAGCATHQPVAVQSFAPAPLVAAATATKLVETKYEVGGYREAANPAVRHEPHAVFRRTRVPHRATDDTETVPRSSFAPASSVPLPASEELAAELTTQKQITAEMRAMQATMAETDRKMQAQYAQLVRQSGEALKLREQLAQERNRAQLAATSPAGPTTPAGGSEVKW